MINLANTHIKTKFGTEEIRYIEKKFKEDEVLSTLIEARKLLPDDYKPPIAKIVPITSSENTKVIDKIGEVLTKFHEPSYEGFKVIQEQKEFLSSSLSPDNRDPEIDILRKEAGLTKNEEDDISYSCK